MKRHQRAKNGKGFSLIEMMIAILIIMISMLALATALTTAIATNQANEIRNAAIRVTNQTAEALLALPFNDAELTVGNHSRTKDDEAQNLKGLPNTVQNLKAYQMTYSITWAVEQMVSAKQVSITVQYTHKNRSFTNSAVIYNTGKL